MPDSMSQRDGRTDRRTDYHVDGRVFTKGILFILHKERLIILKINSDCFPIHKQRVGVCNGDVVCFLRGKLYTLFRWISCFNWFTKFLVLFVVSPDLMLHISLSFFLFCLLPFASFFFVFLLPSLFV